ncbi:hypothetical protein AAC387_Pa02g3194 [Persea americana]
MKNSPIRHCRSKCRRRNLLNSSCPKCQGGDDGRVADIDKMTVTLEPDRITKGGLHVPGKDRMEFRPPERNSLLGLDVLAIAK